MAEIAFEYLALALESTPGTPVSPPTHYANVMGVLTPMDEKYKPEESSGMRVRNLRKKTTRRWAEFDGDGPLDNYVLPVFADILVRTGVTGVQQAATAAYLWEYVPAMTSAGKSTGTWAFGDPNLTQVFQGAYGSINELTITNDASSTDGATVSINGITQKETLIAGPTMPSQIFGPLFTGVNMQVWLDTDLAIGTTELTDRVISATHTFTEQIVPKYLAAGPTADVTYTKLGYGKQKLLTTTVTLELPDYAQYTIFDEAKVAKLRVRHNGPLIESTYYHYVEVDSYGPLESPEWGDYEGVNRTITFTVESQYDATLGADFRLAIMNDRSTL